MLGRSDVLMVLMLEGWEMSVGLQAELAWAGTMAIPVQVVASP
jgi:hypothetical protein